MLLRVSACVHVSVCGQRIVLCNPGYLTKE